MKNLTEKARELVERREKIMGDIKKDTERAFEWILSRIEKKLNDNDVTSICLDTRVVYALPDSGKIICREITDCDASMDDDERTFQTKFDITDEYLNILVKTINNSDCLCASLRTSAGNYRVITVKYPIKGTLPIIY